MVQCRRLLFLFFATILAAGCASGSNADSGDRTNARCDGDCVQPPLRQVDMEDHLQRHQDRILARDDYRENLPPAISTILDGPLINDLHRPGPTITDPDGEPYDGPLDWHLTDFEPIDPSTVTDTHITAHPHSGAHCFFARVPNRKTSQLSLVLSERPGGHRGFIGGPKQPTTPIDEGPLARGATVATDQGSRCLFRHDQNDMGALLVAIDTPDSRRYALYTVLVVGDPRPTGHTHRVTRSAGINDGPRTLDVDIPARLRQPPEITFVDSFDTAYDALRAAEEAIIPGRFRLRPALTYPAMPKQPHLHGGPETYCPTDVRCHTPTMHLNLDERPPLSWDILEERGLLDPEDETHQATEEEP